MVTLSVGMELWLIPIYGATGAAIGSSVARVIAPFFYIRFASRECQIPWPIKDTLKIVLAALIMGAIAFAIEQQISRPIISIAVLVPLGIIIHFSLIIVFKVVQEQDISALRQIQNSIPRFARGVYGLLLDFVEKMVNKRDSTDIRK
jgi:peptidoglycan biosynthesis protein MviN/MurJ (putative lipid II flippase)